MNPEFEKIQKAKDRHEKAMLVLLLVAALLVGGGVLYLEYVKYSSLISVNRRLIEIDKALDRLEQKL